MGDFASSQKFDAKARTFSGNNLTFCCNIGIMAPEVCLGKPYDGKAEVWSVGVVLYELIMLKKPFGCGTI